MTLRGEVARVLSALWERKNERHEYPRPDSSLDLTPDGQNRLAKEHEVGTLEDWFVYHWFDLSDGRTVPGIYDLRKNWRAYLGNVDLKGRRVLEVGPASGFLTFKME